MPTRAPVCACAYNMLLAVAAAIFLTADLTVYADEFTCSRDGLYADYDTECREYVRCSGGSVHARYRCATGRAFSEAAAGCVPARRQPCVRRSCAIGDTLAYATPGTACRNYYRCDNGTVIDHQCPSGAWFDLARQACARGAGTCHEPVCAGLPDGAYPDASHACRRMLKCRGAELVAVASCNGPCSSTCPASRAAAISLPAGDADFCSDEACSSLCHNADDGAYADRSTGCREYFVCEARRVTRRGVCEPGLIFTKSGCVARNRATCPPPARSPCYNRGDGLYRDWRDCRSWYHCHREQVIARGACDQGLVFDGAMCVQAASFPCEGPAPSRQCEGLPSGAYQDLESNCTRYFHCEGSLRTTLECDSDKVFDGSRCVPSAEHECPSFARDGCGGRKDGRYRNKGAGCRAYFTCYGGERAGYACAVGTVFDGESCVPSRPGVCVDEDYSCVRLADGYHAEIDSGCRKYFYCENGDRLSTLSCLGGKIFDGHSCVEPTMHECGAPRQNTIENGSCERDGFYIQQGTECKKYYFCVTGQRTYLNCPEGQVFNGQICVLKNLFTCPG